MIETYVTRISPEAAKVLVERNKNNRNVSEKVVNKYLNAIKSGEWQLNGETIVFDEDGNLKDGQHRLIAIAKSGITVPVVIVKGVSRDVNVFDRGRGRTTTDVLTMRGYDTALSSPLVVGLIRLHYDCLNEKICSDGDIERFVERWKEELVDVYSMTRKPSRNRNGSVSTAFAAMALATLYAYVGGVDYSTLNRFHECVSTGYISDKTESAAVAIRNAILIKKVIAGKRGIEERVAGISTYERAIYDFVNGKERKRAYAPKEGHVYFENFCKEDELRKETQNG